MKLIRESALVPALLVLVGFIVGVVSTLAVTTAKSRAITIRLLEWNDRPINAQEVLLRAAARLARSKDEDERWHRLDGAAMWNVDAGSIEIARKFAKILLADAYRPNDGYSDGKAIHKGNIVLGRIALREGDLDAAKRYLLKAAETPGGPALSSFGPNMLLAKELLVVGETVSVLAYFERCRDFWGSGRVKLDYWAGVVRDGRIPNFGPNLVY